MKLLIYFLAFIIAPFCFSSEDGIDWLSSVAPEFEFSYLPDSSLCEVSDSVVKEIVENELSTSEFLEIRLSMLKRYTNEKCKIVVKKHIYLVRAVYGNKGTGHYFVTQNGKLLLVVHGSLGRISHFGKSALIVSTDQNIEKVYVKISSAN